MKTIAIWLSAIWLVLIFSPYNASSDCQGCCSHHGGVVCSGGVTMCADGSPLSATCRSKGCSACSGYTTPSTTTTTSTSTTSTTTSTTTAISTTTPSTSMTTTTLLSPETLTIASFNIQTFGPTKAGRPEVMTVIRDTVSRFDVIAIQEIRDQSGAAITTLEAQVDSLGANYDYVLSPPLGRTSYTEQYGIMYRSDKVTLLNSYTYDDSAFDFFQREPFIARFLANNGNFDFVLVTIHVDPDRAGEEINAISLAVADATLKFPGETDIVVVGDLNADCSYFNENDQSCTLRGAQYTWLISNDMDTNVAGSECTYDRIIITSGLMEDYANESGVFRFDQTFGLSADFANDVSDHYPVWSRFYVSRDTDVEPWIVQNQCSSYHPVSGKVHIPCFDFGQFYWLDLRLTEVNPISFRLENYGIEPACASSAASFDVTSNRLRVPCLNLGNLPTYWMDLEVGAGPDNSPILSLADFGGNQLLTEADNGRTIISSSGSIITVRLDSNPTTGSQWSIGNLDQSILEEIGHAYVQDPNCCSGCVGCGGNEIWTFRGASPGITRLEMTYARPWEGPASGEAFVFDLQIQ